MQPKIIIGNPELDKWLYADSNFVNEHLEDNQNKVLFETPLSKIMLFVQPNEVLLCGSGDAIASILEKIRSK